jgi:uncharacterized protein YndB with AHSA1/START domain
VAIRVPCEPTEAWERFTAEIGQWWRPNPLFAFSQRRSGALAFEPGVGGRLTETYADGSSFVIGVVSVWDPPRRLVVSWRQASFPPEASTELHVHFERAGPAETRVRRSRRPTRVPAPRLPAPLRRVVAHAPLRRLPPWQRRPDPKGAAVNDAHSRPGRPPVARVGAPRWVVSRRGSLVVQLPRAAAGR